MSNIGNNQLSTGAAPFEITRANVRALLAKNSLEIQNAIEAADMVNASTLDAIISNHSQQMTALMRGRSQSEVNEFFSLYDQESVGQVSLSKTPDISIKPSIDTPPMIERTYEPDSGYYAEQKKQLEKEKEEYRAKAWASILSLLLAVAVMYSILKK